MPVRITATPVAGRDLMAGELFSTLGPIYWKMALDRGSVGERVYIRSNAPADEFPDPDSTVYRITITTEKDDESKPQGDRFHRR